MSDLKGTTAMENLRVVITGAARDFGRTMAIIFARQGAEVFLSARSLKEASRTEQEIRDLGSDRVHAFACDITDPDSVRAFADGVREKTGAVDVLLNNAANWLKSEDLTTADDADILATTASAGGTVLMVKHFLPLLCASQRPDIVTLVSAAGTPNYTGCVGHEAFYAAKGGQAAFTGILSKRLRAKGIRVISLYPSDFDNIDPLSPAWENASRTSKDTLTAQSLAECVTFAVNQPRDCFLSQLHFEPGQ